MSDRDYRGSECFQWFARHVYESNFDFVVNHFYWVLYYIFLCCTCYMLSVIAANINSTRIIIYIRRMELTLYIYVSFYRLTQSFILAFCFVVLFLFYFLSRSSFCLMFGFIIHSVHAIYFVFAVLFMNKKQQKYTFFIFWQSMWDTVLDEIHKSWIDESGVVHNSNGFDEMSKVYSSLKKA